MTDSDAPAGGLVHPETVKGFRDLLPGDMIPRDVVVSVARDVYERYGFAPLDTPVLEQLETLIGTGGEDTNKELFRLEGPEGEPLGMRFDLTVPFARVLAQYQTILGLPFRRYHIGPVFRADKPGPGRFRQFTQFDIDAAGSESLAVDAEIVAAMAEIFRRLGLQNESDLPEFQIRVNNRKLVDALLEASGVSAVNVHKHVLRVMDKLQKVGLDAVKLELGPGRMDESGDRIPGVGLDADAIHTISRLVAEPLRAGSRAEVIEALRGLLQPSDRVNAALQEMEELEQALSSLAVAERDVVFDPSLARGLDYYTGPVFEAWLPQASEFGSIIGGGRYDDLVARFLPERIPATGVSIGIDRLVGGLQHMGKLAAAPSLVEVIVIRMNDVPVVEALKVATEFRLESIRTEVYFGSPTARMSEQLAYANRREIPVAVILGGREIETGTASVKDLRAGKTARADLQRTEYVGAGNVGQITVARSELAASVKNIIGHRPA